MDDWEVFIALHLLVYMKLGFWFMSNKQLRLSTEPFLMFVII